jgi:hypothetical protein
VPPFPVPLAACSVYRETGDRPGGSQTTGTPAIPTQEPRRADRATGRWRYAAAATRDAGDLEKATHPEQLAAGTVPQPSQRWRR